MRYIRDYIAFCYGEVEGGEFARRLKNCTILNAGYAICPCVNFLVLTLHRLNSIAL